MWSSSGLARGGTAWVFDSGGLPYILRVKYSLGGFGVCVSSSLCVSVCSVR